MVPCFYLSVIILKFLIMENWAILSSLNAELLSFIGSLKVTKQNLNGIPKPTLMCKDGLSKFIFFYLASLLLCILFAFIVAGYPPLS